MILENCCSILGPLLSHCLGQISHFSLRFYVFEISGLWQNKIEKLFSSFTINIWFVWFSKQTMVTNLKSVNPLKASTLSPYHFSRHYMLTLLNQRIGFYKTVLWKLIYFLLIIYVLDVKEVPSLPCSMIGCHSVRSSKPVCTSHVRLNRPAWGSNVRESKPFCASKVRSSNFACTSNVRVC